MEAGEAGADYVAFGAFYPTATKPSPYRPDPSILSWWSACIRNSVRRDRGNYRRKMRSPLVEAGADFLAVCQAVWSADDPSKVVTEFNDLLAKVIQ